MHSLNQLHGAVILNAFAAEKKRSSQCKVENTKDKCPLAWEHIKITQEELESLAVEMDTMDKRKTKDG